MPAPDCYQCLYRGDVPGSAHSSCQHPVTARTWRSPFMALAAVVGKRGGVELAALADRVDDGPSVAEAALQIRAADTGRRQGWFVWPVNFDPVWLEACEGFTPTDGANA